MVGVCCSLLFLFRWRVLSSRSAAFFLIKASAAAADAKTRPIVVRKRQRFVTAASLTVFCADRLMQAVTGLSRRLRSLFERNGAFAHRRRLVATTTARRNVIFLLVEIGLASAIGEDRFFVNTEAAMQVRDNSSSSSSLFLLL